MSFSLIWLISYEFLLDKGDGMHRKIVKKVYFTLFRLEKKKQQQQKKNS